MDADAFEGLGIDRALGQTIDLGADSADIAFKSGGGQPRIVRLQRRAKFSRHRVQRRQKRFTTSALSQLVDAFGQVPNGAFQRDDGIPRREVGQTARHRGDLAAHCVDVGDANALIGSKHGVQFGSQRTNVVTHRLRRLDRGAGLPTIRSVARRVITLVGWIAGISALLIRFSLLRLSRTHGKPLGAETRVRSTGFQGRARRRGRLASFPRVQLPPSQSDLRDRGFQIEAGLFRRQRWPNPRGTRRRRRIRNCPMVFGHFAREARIGVGPSCGNRCGAGAAPFQGQGRHIGLRHFDRVRSGLLLGKGETVEARVRALKPQRNRLERLRKSLSIVGHAPLDLLERRLQQVFDLRDLFISRTRRPAPAQTNSPFPACGDPFAATVVKLNVLARFFRSDEGGMLDDRFVQPLFRTHTGAMRGVLGDATGSWAEIRGLPRHSFVHTLDRHRR